MYNYRHLSSERIKRGDGWTSLQLLCVVGVLGGAISLPWRRIELASCTVHPMGCVNEVKVSSSCRTDDSSAEYFAVAASLHAGLDGFDTGQSGDGAVP